MTTTEVTTLCPSCGQWAILNDVTGFCANCSPGICITCGREFLPDTKYRKVCWSCREEAWLAKYADVLESLLIMGHSFSSARELISRDYAPRCSSCGEVINMGRPGESLFCTKYTKCKSAKRRYRTLKQRYKTDVLAYTHVMIELRIHAERVKGT